MSIVYVTLSMLSVAAIALLLSTFTDSALGAALGALAFLIASTLLLTLDAAASLQPYLPTRYWLSFVDLFRDPILWRDIDRGILLQGAYAWSSSAPPGPTSPPRTSPASSPGRVVRDQFVVVSPPQPRIRHGLPANRRRRGLRRAGAEGGAEQAEHDGVGRQVAVSGAVGSGTPTAR